VRSRLAVTPDQYRRVAYVTLAALTLIVLTGSSSATGRYRRLSA
jgi:hypothetical protein